jgi:hypothetical protein
LSASPTQNGALFCLPSRVTHLAQTHFLEGIMTGQSVRLPSVRFALFATLVALVAAPSAFADQRKVVSNGVSANLSAYDGSCAWTWVSVSRNTTATGTSIQYMG